MACPENLRGPPKDFHFKFKFPDPFLRPGELNALPRSNTRDLSPINTILMNPVMQSASTDSKFISGLSDCLIRTNKRNSTQAELDGIRFRHNQSLSKKSQIFTIPR
jgi:hypothetical protein